MSTVDLTPSVDVRRAQDRFTSQFGWLDSKHSFSFGHHFDRANTHHGLLLVNNDDVVDAGTGFDTHPHRDMEIVTWVLEGSLVHQDSTGHNGIIYPGLAQRMSAGSGILHSEKNDSWRLSGDAHTRPGPLRPDVGRARRARHHARLRAARDRPRAALRRPRPGRVRDGQARRRRPRSGSTTGTPPCTPRACSPARASSSPRRRSCTCSSPAAPSPWRAPARWPPGTRSGSPPPEARRSPPPSRPRSWCGRCTPPSPHDHRPSSLPRTRTP